MKHILCAALAFILILTAFPINVLAKSSIGLQEPQSHYMEWPFSIYTAPDFRAEKVETFLPQQILIYEHREDGWVLLHTYRGEYWTYLNENKIYIDRYYSIYDNKGDTTAVGGISDQVVKVIGQQDSWFFIETLQGLKWIDTNDPRGSVLLDVPAYNQRALGYPTGCEIVSVSMMINFTTEADIEVLVDEMPRSHNPYNGFVGNPSTKNGFSIFPQALLGLTQNYLGSAEDMTGGSMDDLKKKLKEGAPVVVWVNGLGFYVHAICLTGYDENGFYYNDPWRGTKDTFIMYNKFYDIWNKPIPGDAGSSRKALSYTPL